MSSEYIFVGKVFAFVTMLPLTIHKIFHMLMLGKKLLAPMVNSIQKKNLI